MDVILALAAFIMIIAFCHDASDWKAELSIKYDL